MKKKPQFKKPQFKIGDKVIIRDNEKYDPCELASGYVQDMTQFAGQEATIKTVGMDARGLIEYRLEGVGYWWDERLLRPVGERVIVVYRKGNDVIALNKLTGEKGVAHCSPEDKFDFDVGAKIAFCRLYGKEPELAKKKEKKGPFHVLCVSASMKEEAAKSFARKRTSIPFFCVGKIYEVDGTIRDEEGYHWGVDFKSAKEINDYFKLNYRVEFIECAEVLN